MKQSVAGKILRAIVGSRGSIVAPLSPEWQRERRIIAETRTKTQLLLTDPAALHLLACVRATRSLSGDFVEAGVFEGGSARLICEAKGDKPLHLFDVFETLQSGAWGEGTEVSAHFGATHGRENDVRRLLARYPGVHFHTGLVTDTMHDIESSRFSFVHLDLDLVEPTTAALEFFHPRMARGGILLVDDYCDRFLKRCVDDWFAGREDTLVELPWSQMMVVRQSV